MDRVAFMQQYTPMFEREKQRAMTPEYINKQIDRAAASIPDNSRNLLEARETERRKQKDLFDILSNNERMELGTSERPQLTE